MPKESYSRTRETNREVKMEKKLQDERFDKIQSKKNLLENKIAQIHKEASNSLKNKVKLKK